MVKCFSKHIQMETDQLEDQNWERYIQIIRKILPEENGIYLIYFIISNNDIRYKQVGPKQQ